MPHPDVLGVRYGNWKIIQAVPRTARFKKKTKKRRKHSEPGGSILLWRQMRVSGIANKVSWALNTDPFLSPEGQQRSCLSHQ